MQNGESQDFNIVASRIAHEAGGVIEKQFFGDSESSRQFLGQVEDLLVEAQKIPKEWDRGFVSGTLMGAIALVDAFSKKLTDDTPHEIPTPTVKNRSSVVGMYLSELKFLTALRVTNSTEVAHNQNAPTLQKGLDKGEDYTMERARSVFHIRLERKVEDCLAKDETDDQRLFCVLGFVAGAEPHPNRLVSTIGYESIMNDARERGMIVQNYHDGQPAGLDIAKSGVSEIRKLGGEVLKWV